MKTNDQVLDTRHVSTSGLVTALTTIFNAVLGARVAGNHARATKLLRQVNQMADELGKMHL